MAGNWDDEEDESPSSTPAKLVPKSKWDDEEDSDEPVLDSWDASESEDEKPAKPVMAAPPKKTLKQKIAEREEEARKKMEEKIKQLEAEKNETPAERRARLQAIQLQADLDNAADLFGDVVALEDKEIPASSVPTESVLAESVPAESGVLLKEPELEDLALMKPKTREQFDELNARLGDVLTSLSGNPAYATTFLPSLMKALVQPLNSEQVRKCASTLTAVGNEKIKEERAADKPSKKKKSKPGLSNASAKIDDNVDTTNYSRYDELDDFM
ncbi:eukaryotic translation initiation factor 3 subunit J [Lipomyces tetrasporus]|uniref:Eukaryotic translation initiation factor 3 subunit J n=1 Tax=Lipomyces tetrasporus TaxID=54092 RepID=A0AAD7QWJ1_9ASCO|nr:eukaryotic translation initiation factor 3 subunit J [Lipomyces tetrasporus]KAJ8102799.1 eukaryotic translation initiation factor 3 subunit J [Lipomyces tetrasporus]